MANAERWGPWNSLGNGTRTIRHKGLTAHCAPFSTRFSENSRPHCLGGQVAQRPMQFEVDRESSDANVSKSTDCVFDSWFHRRC